MIYFVEFRLFDVETLHKTHQKMNAVSANSVRWIEWPSMLALNCEKPDLTLINSKYLHWREIAAAANAANGRHIALLGDCQFTLGLSKLPWDFSLKDLLPLEYKGPQTSTPRPRQLREPLFKSTFPMTLDKLCGQKS